MRTFASAGTCSFLAGLFLFTRGLAGHPTSLLLGAVVGLLGLVILGMMASHPEQSSADFGPRPKRRQRRRSSAGMTSLRTRSQLGTAGGR